MYTTPCLLLGLAILILPNLVHSNAYENTCVFNENSGDFSIHYNDKKFVIDINKLTNNEEEEITTTVASTTTTDQTIICPLDYQLVGKICRRCSVEGFVLVGEKCVNLSVTTSTGASTTATTPPPCDPGYVINSIGPHKWNFYAERGDCIPEVRLSHGHKGTIHVYVEADEYALSTPDKPQQPPTGVYQSVCSDIRTLTKDHPWTSWEWNWDWSDSYKDYWHQHNLYENNRCYYAPVENKEYDIGQAYGTAIPRSCYNFYGRDNEKTAEVVCRQLFGTKARNWKGKPGAADLYEDLNLDSQHFGEDHWGWFKGYCHQQISYQGLTWYDLQCDGNEDRLENCHHKQRTLGVFGVANCDENSDIWVDCYEL